MAKAKKVKRSAEEIINEVIARGIIELPIEGDPKSMKWSFGVACLFDKKKAIFSWKTFRYTNCTYSECVKDIKKIIKQRGLIVDKFYGLDATNIDF